jgi:predicted molibdopterin-dependent oxidoreductase YjgC
VAGLAASFGSGAMTNSIDEIENTDLIFITGSNTSEAHPIIGRKVKRAVDRKRAKLIIVDPRKVVMTNFAHMWLRPLPGTDVAWINGLIHTIIEEGLWDKSFVEERTEDFDLLKESIADYTPEYVEQIANIPADQLRAAARLYAKAPRAMILYAMGITQHTSGTNNVKALANLTMLCGNVGKEGTGLNPLRGQNNVQGACDMGALPNVLPGYQPVINESILAKFQQGWGTGTRLSNRVGLTVTEMFPAALENKIRAMYIMGENPALSDANTKHVIKALETLDFLVVQDIFLTETARRAHVVLPAASFAEKDGTFTNTERRIQRIRKALNPPGNARSDWEIICALSTRMGEKLNTAGEGPSAQNSNSPYFRLGHWEYSSTAEIFDEIAGLTPSYGGLNYERIEQGELQWPCPTKYHPGTPFLHKDRFARGRGKFHALTYRPPAEMPDETYPFYLSTGRIRFQYHTGTMTRRSPSLDLLAPEERVQINPEDAMRLGIEDENWVRVISRRGVIKARALLTDRTAPGMVFSTFHFAESPINELTNDVLDEVSKIPEFKVCAVRIEKCTEVDEAQEEISVPTMIKRVEAC